METTTRYDLDLEALTLQAGSHEADGVMCVMEAVAYMAGEPWSDSPQCACPVIAAFCRAWNDSAEPYGSAIRARLKTYIPQLVTSRGSVEQEWRRSLMALDWLIRVHLVAWLRRVPALRSHAKYFAGLADLSMPDTDYRAIGAQVHATWIAAQAAAWDATGDATGGGAWAPAWDAVCAAGGAAAWNAARTAAQDTMGGTAWDAVRSAPRTAAQAAVHAAAWAPAWDAARTAAQDVLSPTVTELQVSAWELLDRMLAVVS